MQNNKLLRGALENDSIQHRHDPSTPKHNRSRKKIRRAVKYKERRDDFKFESKEYETKTWC